MCTFSRTAKGRSTHHTKVVSSGFDVFFDNVGGFILNETLRRLNMKARVVVCGAISGYN